MAMQMSNLLTVVDRASRVGRVNILITHIAERLLPQSVARGGCPVGGYLACDYSDDVCGCCRVRHMPGTYRTYDPWSGHGDCCVGCLPGCGSVCDW